MCPDVVIAPDFRDAPNINSLALALGTDRFKVIGHLVVMHCWMAVHGGWAGDGDGPGATTGDLEFAAQWDGPEGALIGGLQDVGMLYTDENGLKQLWIDPINIK